MPELFRKRWSTTHTRDGRSWVLTKLAWNRDHVIEEWQPKPAEKGKGPDDKDDKDDGKGNGGKKDKDDQGKKPEKKDKDDQGKKPEDTKKDGTDTATAKRTKDDTGSASSACKRQKKL